MTHKFVGYFENWAQWREEGGSFKPDAIDPGLYTHINFAFADFGFLSPAFSNKGGPKLTGDFKMTPHESNDEKELYPALQKLKQKNPNLKTIISIGGWNYNDKTSQYSGKWTSELFSRMASKGEHRQEFIESAIEFALHHGFDGIDIDWEYPGDMRQAGNVNGADDFANYLTLLAEFRSAINGKNLLLTIAGPAIVTTGVPDESPYKDPKKYFEWLGNCATHLDWLNIMAYDYHGAFDPITGVLAPLLEDSVPDGQFCVKNTVEAYKKLAKIPLDKLVLGIGTYGRTFVVTNPLSEDDNKPNKHKSAPGPAGAATKEAGVLAYYEITQRLSSNQFTRVWHDCTHTPYAYNPATGEWISYEDEESVAYKTSYLLREGLGGAMIWSIAQDDFKNGFPLQRKIKEILDNPEQRPEIVWHECSTSNLPNVEEDNLVADAYSPAIAVNSKGVVAQVFIDKSGEGDDKDTLFVRVGKHTPEGVIWSARDKVSDKKAGGSKDSQLEDRNTAIAINNNNYIVVVFTSSEKGNERDNWKLYYRNGRIEGYSIDWLSDVMEYDNGINPSIALTDDNTFVGVHQAGKDPTSHFRHYRTGQINGGGLVLSQPQKFQNQGGDELGKYPAIAVTTLDSGEKVALEVHTSEVLSSELWYRLGIIQGDNINWGTSISQSDTGNSSSVAITKDGYVVEVHKSNEFGGLWYKVAKLNTQGGMQLDWLITKAHKFGNGLHPSVALAGGGEDYILVQTNKADSSGDFIDNRVITRATIKMVSLFVGDMSFVESVGIDLESHGIQLNPETDEWEKIELQIPPSSKEEVWEKFKLSIMWIPVIPNVISLIENSINCDAGNEDACKGIGIDAAFLAIEIIPLGAVLKVVKAPAKSIVGVLKGISEVGTKFKLDDILDTLRSKNLGPIADWFKRHPNAFNKIRRTSTKVDIERLFPCLGSSKKI
jgi:GH18 family chitinase